MTSVHVKAAAFYVAVAGALIVLMTKHQKSFLPDGLATQIGHNSEALLFALLVCAGIQIRRNLLGSARLIVLLGGGAVLVVLGVLLLQTNWTSSVRTLNEALIGAGLVLAYTTLPRSRRVGCAFSLAVLLVIVVFFSTAVVLDQAESLVPLTLAGLALDVFDRTIPQPDERDEPALRWVWMGLMLVAVVAFMFGAAWARQDLHGPLRLGLDYGQRAAEAYWGWLLVHGYFGVWIGREWRADRAQSRDPVVVA